VSRAAPERLLQRLDWKVVHRLDGLLQGEYRTLFYGNGVDFADLREYVPGDDVRNIDWNVTARMDVPYVRQYVEDRDLTAWFLLDLTPSVDFGTVETDREKRSVLVEFVATLSRLLTRRGNRIAAQFFGAGVERTIPPAGGRPAVLRLMKDLMEHPRLASAPLTDLSPMLERAGSAIRRRSLVFLVSDFISEPGWERPLSLMARRHELICVRLTDPRETQLPDVGHLMIQDAETGEQLLVDTHDRGFQRRFAEASAARETQIRASFARAGTEAMALSTEDDLVAAIVRMAELRRRRRRAA
jgi:uncharacterized protein (DUF58 family)